MFKSLYSVLLPLVAEKKTGTLDIHHAGGGEARAILKDGKILMLQTLDLQGSDAAKKMAMWIDFTTEFFPDAEINSPNKVTISTQQFLLFFEKVDKRIDKINKIITKITNRYRFLPSKLNNTIEFEAAQLEIAMKLDGKHTVAEILKLIPQPELQTLSHIAIFCSKGFVEIVEDEKPIPEKDKAEFFLELNEILADLLGPAAEIIIDDALETIGSDEKNLSQSKIPDLIDAVLSHLDPEDRVTFRNWSAAQLEKYTQ